MGNAGRMAYGSTAQKGNSSAVVVLWVLFFFCSVLPLPVPNGYDWVFALVIFLVIFSKQIYLVCKFIIDTPLVNCWLIAVEVIGFSFLLTFILFVKITFLFYAVTFCLVIPFAYAVFQRFGAERVVFELSKGFYIAFVILLAVSFIFGPPYKADIQYSAIFSNPNEFGYILTSVMPCIGYFLVKSAKENKGYQYLHIASIALVVTMSIMTGSRTTQLSLVPQIIVVLVLLLRLPRFRKNETGGSATIWNGLLTGVLVFVIASSATVGAFTVGKHALETCAGVTSEHALVASVSPNVENGLEAMVESVSTRYSKGMSDGNINDFSSGRLGIFASFMQDIDILGHESETKQVVSGWRFYEHTYAHNVFIQVAYSAGLFAGVAMFFIAVFSLFRSIIVLREKEIVRGSWSAVSCVTFSACAVTGFFIYALFGDGYAMFKYLPASVFWIASAALCSLSMRMRCRQKEFEPHQQCCL